MQICQVFSGPITYTNTGDYCNYILFHLYIYGIANYVLFCLFVASSYDVRIGTYRLNFYSSVSTYTVKVAIRDDKLVEGTEAFGVQLILGGYRRPYCLKLGKPSVATVFIKDGTYTPSVDVLY